MVQQFFVKRGDTPMWPLKVTLSASDPSFVDLTGCTEVRILVRLPGASQPKINAAGEIVSSANRIVQYNAWTEGDCDTPGVYRVEFQLTFTGGKKVTFPNKTWPDNDRIELVVTDDLGP